jgi:membrane protease YdiL (CAAX protease family)
MRSPRYSPRQLVAAKCVVVAVFSVAGAIAIADDRGDLPAYTFVMLGLLALGFAGYELLSRMLAAGLGRLHPPTSALEPDQPAAEPASAEPARLRPKHLVLLVLGFLAAQTIVWTVGGAMVGVRSGFTDEKAFGAGLLHLAPVLLPAGSAAGGLALILTLRFWIRRFGAEAYAAIVSPRWGTRRQIMLAALGGAAAAIAYIGLASLIPYTGKPSLLTQAAMTAGGAQWAWVVSAVILAPPIEEALFRGALLGGMASLWGLRTAAAGSALTFLAMHGTEWIRYWPAVVGLGLMTLLVTGIRLRTGALGGCMAAHLGYNLILSLVALAAG